MSKKERTVYSIIAAVASVLLVWYVGYNLYMGYLSNVSIERADIYTVNDVITVDAFVVRDEVRLDSSGDNRLILKSSSDGVYLPAISDGSRVAERDVVAYSFADSSQARNYAQLEMIEEDIAYYEKLQKQTVLSSVDVGALNNRIEQEVHRYTSFVENGDFSKLTQAAKDIEHSMASRQIATGVKLDFTEVLQQLYQQQSAMKTSVVQPLRLTTSYPGYFVGNVDGYEQKAAYKDVSNLTVAQIDELLSSQPASVPENAFGKVICAYEWYLVCSAPDSTLMYIESGSKVNVTFGETDVQTVRMKVHSVSESQDGKVALVLSCSEMNEYLAGLRIEEVDITLRSYSGYKVGNSALRENENGEIGVYVLYGNIVRFRKTNIIHYADNYVIVAEYTAESANDELKLYDSVIVKGRGLYDGKLISA